MFKAAGNPQFGEGYYLNRSVEQKRQACGSGTDEDREGCRHFERSVIWALIRDTQKWYLPFWPLCRGHVSPLCSEGSPLYCSSMFSGYVALFGNANSCCNLAA